MADFLAATKNQYGAEFVQFDFARDAETARQSINAWIEEQAENKITGLIPAGAITPDTRLVLTNAVYFHGIWSEPFKRNHTENEDFHLTATDKINVPMMHRWDGTVLR